MNTLIDSDLNEIFWHRSFSLVPSVEFVAQLDSSEYVSVELSLGVPVELIRCRQPSADAEGPVRILKYKLQ